MPNPTAHSKVSEEIQTFNEEIEFLEALSNGAVVPGMKYKDKMFMQFLDSAAAKHHEAKSKPIPHVGPNPPRGRRLF